MRVRVPLSVANVGPGFDRFAFCLEGPSDLLDLRLAGRTTLEVEGDSEITKDPRLNCATVAAQELAELVGRELSFHARLRKGFRGGSGMGSSGASSVAGALGAAALLGLDSEDPETARFVLRASIRGEAAAVGTGHMDNVSASLFGGFVVVEDADLPIVVRLQPPAEFRAVIAVPHQRLTTQESRSVLPSMIPRADAVSNLAHASTLLVGLLQGDLDRVGRNLVDRLAEPYRTPLIPGSSTARARALGAGALGVALAGSGPALWALARPERVASIAQSLRAGFLEENVDVEVFVSGVGTGPQLEDWQ